MNNPILKGISKENTGCLHSVQSEVDIPNNDTKYTRHR